MVLNQGGGQRGNKGSKTQVLTFSQMEFSPDGGKGARAPAYVVTPSARELGGVTYITPHTGN